MALETVDKKENGKKLREFHQPTFEKMGLVNPTLYGKLVYMPTGKSELYTSFFHSEISRGADVFIESTNRDLVPEKEDRALYMWKFNPHFGEEYERTQEADITKVRYLIPISELIVIKRYNLEEIFPIKNEEIIIETDAEKEIIENKDFDFNSPVTLTDKEAPITEMTIRDFAAIILKKPVSRKEWLNEIIKSK
jgi:hypothetical protein